MNVFYNPLIIKRDGDGVSKKRKKGKEGHIQK